MLRRNGRGKTGWKKTLFYSWHVKLRMPIWGILKQIWAMSIRFVELFVHNRLFGSKPDAADPK